MVTPPVAEEMDKSLLNSIQLYWLLVCSCRCYLETGPVFGCFLDFFFFSFKKFWCLVWACKAIKTMTVVEFLDLGRQTQDCDRHILLPPFPVFSS